MGRLHPQRPKYQSPYAARSATYLDKDAQLDLIRKLALMTLTASALTLLPSLYFVNVNYNLIRELLPQTAPQILKHVEREQVLFNVLVLTALSAQLTFLAVFSKRMTAQIVAPIKKITEHLRQLSRGDFTQPPVKTREGDQMQNLVMAYNYFYQSLRRQEQKQLQTLQKISKSGISTELKAELLQITEQKSKQLGAKLCAEVIPLISEESGKAAGSRHVS